MGQNRHIYYYFLHNVCFRGARAVGHGEECKDEEGDHGGEPVTQPTKDGSLLHSFPTNNSFNGGVPTTCLRPFSTATCHLHLHSSTHKAPIPSKYPTIPTLLPSLENSHLLAQCSPGCGTFPSSLSTLSLVEVRLSNNSPSLTRSFIYYLNQYTYTKRRICLKTHILCACASEEYRVGQHSNMPTPATQNWLHINGLDFDAIACSFAARNGNLDMLMQLLTEGCPCNMQTCIDAAEGGHTILFTYAVNGGCPINKQTFHAAARRGDVIMLNRLYSANCSWDEDTYAEAIRGGHPLAATIIVLEWLHGAGCPMNARACTAAAEHGNLELLQWLHGVGCEWKVMTFAAAARRRNLHILQYLFNNHCDWNEGTFAEAARGGHQHVIEWLLGNQCPFDEGTCMAAAEQGNRALLQFLRREGFPWAASTCIAAARGGHRAVLRWLSNNHCPRTSDVCLEAALSGDFSMLTYAHNLGFPWNELVPCAAVWRCHFRMLSFAYHSKCPYNQALCLRIPFIHADIKIWLQNHQSTVATAYIVPLFLIQPYLL